MPVANEKIAVDQASRGVLAGEREIVRRGAGIGAFTRAGGGHVVTAPHDTRRCGRAGSAADGLCYHRRARRRGRFHAMANITQQKKRIRTAADQRLENLRYRSTIKTLTKRLTAAVEDGDVATVEAEHRASSSGSTARSPAARCTGTRPRARSRRPPGLPHPADNDRVSQQVAFQLPA